MPIRTSVQQLWHQSPSGLMVPGGSHTYLASLAYPTFLQIKEKAVALEHLYTTSDVRLAPTCDLGQLIADAKMLSDTWLLGQGSHGITHTLLLRVGYLYRIANAMLPLRDVLKRTTYLTAMTSGRLDCFARTGSKAKNALWELELWNIVQWRSFDAVLDEPDIVVRSNGAKIGIACKKLYSEKHVQRVLSKAVDQIENSSCDVGIVAITIEDCVVPRKILTFSTHEAMRQALDHYNLQFLHVRNCNRNELGLQSTEISDQIICVYPFLRDRIICK